ncbi:DUF2330 domain-containing protein [Streptomyces sp. NPDC056061]|uniref:DUF2330 domain-containing protein n=1 Tax=Streptomyces sp. NPDC056061 TaxID=3345700 RepID=UPI0035D8A3F4
MWCSGGAWRGPCTRDAGPGRYEGGARRGSRAGGPPMGDLDPLRLRFASDRLVYPMRLSKLASVPQRLGLYVLAEHRMEPRYAIGGEEPQVTYAGRLDAGSVGDGTGALATVTGGKATFLTAIEQSFPRPERIDGDHELRAAASDTPYRTPLYRNELLTMGGVPAWLLSVAGTLLVVAVAATVLVRRTRRRRAPTPPVAVTAPPPLR